ncbi:hypothetical protein CP960_06195 [Malaciobacter halophilus]|uniref:Uncharacterized protein n=1 Tax=Malaciobacter halophilus TaxID=197482 RepID=A0A2N1J3K8_9BACT|nr:hypothetical protein [Malaciobacter halophilus]AXH09055.1 hypothetical protein AHALO_0669 [Malaciobacter halophilus]PKI81147.1 hypothetical protein CP960_06195 [Malaciobacter halophilus]
MRRGANDSLIVNNIFTFGTIVIISVVITLYSTYLAPKQQKQEDKVVYLGCFDKNSTLRIKKKKILKNSLKALEKGYYKLSGGYIQPLEAKSYIKDYISLEEQDSYFIDAIQMAPLKNPNKYLTIKYELIENDRDKKEFGAINISIRINGKEIFGVFTNLLYFDKIELRKITDCTIRTFKANAK